MGKNVSYVWCNTCNEWVSEEDIEFIDISEGILGQDLLEFLCKECRSINISERKVFVRE